MARFQIPFEQAHVVDLYQAPAADPARSRLAPELQDVADKLEPPSRERLFFMRDQRDARRTLHSGVLDQLALLREKRHDVERRIHTLRMNQAPRPIPDDHPSIAALVAEMEQTEPEWIRLQNLVEQRSAARNHCGQILERVERELLSLPHDVIKTYPGTVEPRLRKGETAADAIERMRRSDLPRNAADIRETAGALYLSSKAFAVTRDEIERLARRGCPDFMHPLETSEPPRWPTTTAMVPVHGQGADGTAFRGFASVEIFDARAFHCWLHKDALLARAEREIAELSDDASALSDANRAERLAELAAERLLLERQECALIEIAASRGHEIDHRATVDLRAVLALADDMVPGTDA